MLTTLPPSCADCIGIWEPQPPGTFRASPACNGIAFYLLIRKDNACTGPSVLFPVQQCYFFYYPIRTSTFIVLRYLLFVFTDSASYVITVPATKLPL